MIRKKNDKIGPIFIGLFFALIYLILIIWVPNKVLMIAGGAGLIIAGVDFLTFSRLGGAFLFLSAFAYWPLGFVFGAYALVRMSIYVLALIFADSRISSYGKGGGSVTCYAIGCPGRVLF